MLLRWTSTSCAGASCTTRPGSRTARSPWSTAEPPGASGAGPTTSSISVPTTGQAGEPRTAGRTARGDRGRRAAAGPDRAAPRRRSRHPQRCARRGDGRRVPRAAGPGLRRGGRAGARRRAVGRGRGAGRVRRTRIVPATLGRPGVDHRADDRDRHRAARGRRGAALRRAVRGARPDGRRDLPARARGPAGLPGRPAVPPGADRLPHRHRGGHDRGATGERHQGPRRGRHVPHRPRVLRRPSRPGPPADATTVRGGAGVPARHPDAPPPRPRTTARGAARGRCDGGVLPGTPGRAGGRRRPAGCAAAGAAGRGRGRCHGPAAPGHQRGDRGLLRQRAHPPGLRRTANSRRSSHFSLWSPS